MGAAEQMLAGTEPRNGAYGILQNQILTLEIKPGEMLSESILSAQMNAGRPMVRDALSQLTEEGYVVVYPQKGTVVTLIDMERVRQAVYTHSVLEQAVITEVCERGLTREGLSALQKVLMVQKAENEREDIRRLITAEQQFHYVLASLCGREGSWDLFRTLDCDLLRVNYLEYSTFNYNIYMSSLTSWENRQVENRLMVDNLRKGDADAAKLICTNHYNTVLWNAESLRTIYPQFFSG